MLRRPATEDGGTSRNDRLFGQLNYYKLRKLAEKTGRKISELAREAVDIYFSEKLA